MMIGQGVVWLLNHKHVASNFLSNPGYSTLLNTQTHCLAVTP